MRRRRRASTTRACTSTSLGVAAVPAGVHAHRAADRSGDPDEELEARPARGRRPGGRAPGARPRRPPRRAPVRGRSTSLLERRRRARSRPRRTRVGDEEVRSPTDDEHRDVRCRRGRRRPRGSVVLVLDAHERGERTAAAVGRERRARRVASATWPRQRALERLDRRGERHDVRHDASQTSGIVVRSPAPSVSTTSPGRRARPADRRGRGGLRRTRRRGRGGASTLRRRPAGR